MTTLVLGTPSSRVALDNARDFETVLRLRVGDAYCFSPEEVRELTADWDVIVQG